MPVGVITMKKILGFCAVLLAGVLPVVLTVYALSPGGACDFGFGREKASQREAFLRQMFPEPLPARVELDTFSCGGFKDRQIDATFRINATDSLALLEALKQTQQTPRSDPDLPNVRNSMQTITHPNYKQIEFQLPAQSPMHRRDITITVPTDGSQDALVKVLFFQM
jgi:hypothetical protein